MTLISKNMKTVTLTACVAAALAQAAAGCANDEAGAANGAEASALDDDADMAGDVESANAESTPGRTWPFGFLFPRRRDAGVRPPVVDAGVETPTDPGPSEPPPVTSGQGVTLVPHRSWTCGMPQGVPPPELGTPAFNATFAVKGDYDLGTTQYGKRRVLAFGSGTFEGPSLRANLLSGGFELPLTLPNGAFETEQVLTLRTNDGVPIYLRVCGLAASEAGPQRVVMDFEAPNSGRYGSLNTAKLVGTRERSADGKQVVLRVYDVSKVALTANKVTVQEPSGLADQRWECATGSGTKGAEIYRETVRIGGSISVGASKRGNRNIIPITGGTTSGRIVGTVLPLGADYQILSNGFELDARYVVKSNDGEYIIVRNCGPASKLIPEFEASASGRYAFLNENNWLSSSPSVGLGSVSLTIYAKR